jgi:S-disulfanyl-L-cysteine oxidoreductase SoxD
MKARVRAVRTMALAGAGFLWAGTAACEPEPALHGSPAGGGAMPAPSATVQRPPPADTFPGSRVGLPPGPLGLGREPSPEEIAERDLDVRPDGTGLPPGSGTARAGAPVYAARCAACHGPEGHGTPAGWPLVGRNPGDAFNFNESLVHEERRTVGNYWPYATTLFDYTRRAMPADRPGSLTDDEVYALTAWILWRNGLVGEDEIMDARALPAVPMPSRDRFVPDDRARGGGDPD